MDFGSFQALGTMDRQANDDNGDNHTTTAVQTHEAWREHRESAHGPEEIPGRNNAVGTLCGTPAGWQALGCSTREGRHTDGTGPVWSGGSGKAPEGREF